MATLNIRTKNGREYVQLNWIENGKQERRSLGPVGKITDEQATLALKAKELELAAGQPLVISSAQPGQQQHIIIRSQPVAPVGQPVIEAQSGGQPGVITNPLFETHVTEYLTWHKGKYPTSHFRTEGICNNELLTAVSAATKEPYFKGKRLAAITTKDVDLWVAARGPQVASNTMVKEFKTLNALMNKAIAWNALAENKNPCAKADRPKSITSHAPVWYRSEQCQLMYKRPEHGTHWKWMANTGLRRMEALNMHPDKVDETRREVHVDSVEGDDTDGSEGRTKSGHHRVVPLSDTALEAFKQCMAGRENQDRIIPRLTKESFSRAFHRDAVACKLPAGGTHIWRHTYAAHMLKNGVSLRELKDLLGHADIATTMIYAHICEGSMRDKARTISI